MPAFNWLLAVIVSPKTNVTADNVPTLAVFALIAPTKCELFATVNAVPTPITFKLAILAMPSTLRPRPAGFEARIVPDETVKLF